MSKRNVKNELVIFANTLWFIINFKKSLIEELLKRGYSVKIIYLIPFAIFLLLALAKKFNKRYKTTKQIPMIKNKFIKI